MHIFSAADLGNNTVKRMEGSPKIIRKSRVAVSLAEA